MRKIEVKSNEGEVQARGWRVVKKENDAPERGIFLMINDAVVVQLCSVAQ